jgi:hypothetical protein
MMLMFFEDKEAEQLAHAQVAPVLLARRTASNVPALTGLEFVHFQNVSGHGLAVFYSRSLRQLRTCRRIGFGQRCAISGREQSQQNLRLFDHLVGAGEQRGRHVDAERLRGHLVELARLRTCSTLS